MRSPTFPIFLGLLALLACGRNSPDASGIVLPKSFVVADDAHLPTCGEDTQNALAYVIDGDWLYVCTDLMWKKIVAQEEKPKESASQTQAQPQPIPVVTVIPGKDGNDGRDGRDGEPGQAGVAGTPGPKGQDGRDGEAGRDGKDGAAGQAGRDGRDGKPGEIIREVSQVYDADGKALGKLIRETEEWVSILFPDGKMGLFNQFSGRMAGAYFFEKVSNTPGYEYRVNGTGICGFESTDCTGPCVIFNGTSTLARPYAGALFDSGTALYTTTGKETPKGSVLIKSKYSAGQCVDLSAPAETVSLSQHYLAETEYAFPVDVTYPFVGPLVISK